MSWLLAPAGSISDIGDISNVTKDTWVKGDILVYNGSSFVDLAVGTNTHVLTANSATATGLEWQAPSVGLQASDNATITGNWTFNENVTLDTADLILDNTRAVRAENSGGNVNLYLDCTSSASGNQVVGVFRNGATTTGQKSMSWFKGNTSTTFARMAWDTTDSRDGLSIVNDAHFHMEQTTTPPTVVTNYASMYVDNEDTPVMVWRDEDDDDFYLDGRSAINTQNGNYTLVYGDRGKTIYKASGGAGETITIPANGTTSFPVGTLIGIDNDGGGDLTIAITTDTLVGTDGTTGSKTLTDNNSAVIQKIATTRWRYGASDYP